MVKNLSYVNYAAWKVFPINSLATYCTSLNLNSQNQDCSGIFLKPPNIHTTYILLSSGSASLRWKDQNSTTEQFTTWIFTNSQFNQFTKSIFCILGAQLLVEKLKQYKPRVAVFNGKGIFEVFARQTEFHFGKQPDKIEGTETVSIWLLSPHVLRISKVKIPNFHQCFNQSELAYLFFLSIKIWNSGMEIRGSMWWRAHKCLVLL